MIGLDSVKESVRNFFDLVDTNYHRELEKKEPFQMSLNRVFLGSRRTGKTTVAKLYEQILTELGLLSNGEGNTLYLHCCSLVGCYQWSSRIQLILCAHSSVTRKGTPRQSWTIPSAKFWL